MKPKILFSAYISIKSTYKSDPPIDEDIHWIHKQIFITKELPIVECVNEKVSLCSEENNQLADNKVPSTTLSDISLNDHMWFENPLFDTTINYERSR